MIYPIGIQTFEDIRNKGFVYVDKTHHIYKLANTGKCYFLSRPRRFGKSLLISTMEAYFSGKKELFKGLALEKFEQEWTQYPILHLDLNTGKYDNEEELYYRLDNTLYHWEQMYGTEEKENTLSLRFEGVVHLPMIYQSGYLTIKGYNPEFEGYLLGFPNREVEKGFINFLLPRFTPVKENDTIPFVTQFVQAVRRGLPEDFMQILQTLFEDNDYRIAGKMEIYFQNVMYTIFKMLGFYVEVEHVTSKGRIDIVMKTKDYVYVMELKLDGSAEEALQQIEDKGYAKPFAMDSRKLYKIGVNFSSATRGIEEYLIM